MCCLTLYYLYVCSFLVLFSCISLSYVNVDIEIKNEKKITILFPQNNSTLRSLIIVPLPLTYQFLKFFHSSWFYPVILFSFIKFLCFLFAIATIFSCVSNLFAGNRFSLSQAGYKQYLKSCMAVITLWRRKRTFSVAKSILFPLKSLCTHLF